MFNLYKKFQHFFQNFTDFETKIYFIRKCRCQSQATEHIYRVRTETTSSYLVWLGKQLRSASFITVETTTFHKQIDYLQINLDAVLTFLLILQVCMLWIHSKRYDFLFYP